MSLDKNADAILWGTVFLANSIVITEYPCAESTTLNFIPHAKINSSSSGLKHKMQNHKCYRRCE